MVHSTYQFGPWKFMYFILEHGLLFFEEHSVEPCDEKVLNIIRPWCLAPGVGNSDAMNYLKIIIGAGTPTERICLCYLFRNNNQGSCDIFKISCFIIFCDLINPSDAQNTVLLFMCKYSHLVGFCKLCCSVLFTWDFLLTVPFVLFYLYLFFLAAQDVFFFEVEPLTSLITITYFRDFFKQLIVLVGKPQYCICLVLTAIDKGLWMKVEKYRNCVFSMSALYF